MEEKKRVSKFTNLINAVRNANDIGEGVKKNIEQYTKEKISKRMKEIEGQNSGYIAGYSKEERTTDGFGIGEIDY